MVLIDHKRGTAPEDARKAFMTVELELHAAHGLCWSNLHATAVALGSYQRKLPDFTADLFAKVGKYLARSDPWKLTTKDSSHSLGILRLDVDLFLLAQIQQAKLDPKMSQQLGERLSLIAAERYRGTMAERLREVLCRLHDASLYGAVWKHMRLCSFRVLDVILHVLRKDMDACYSTASSASRMPFDYVWDAGEIILSYFRSMEDIPISRACPTLRGEYCAFSL